MKRFLVWCVIATPPVLLILLSLKPLEIFSLYFFGFLAIILLSMLMMAVPALRSQDRLGRPMIASLLIVAFIIAFHWPLRMAYAFSLPALEQVAQQVTTGEVVKAPRRIGLFRIERVEAPGPAANGVDHHGLRLWTTVHPYGNTGFVKASPDDLKFNLWSHFKLDETWQFISED